MIRWRQLNSGTQQKIPPDDDSLAPRNEETGNSVPWNRLSKRSPVDSTASTSIADQVGAEQHLYGQLIFNRGRPCLLRCVWICSRNYTCDRKCQCDELDNIQ